MVMSSVATYKFIKTKAIFRYHTKGVTNQFHQSRITKSKVIHVHIAVPKWEKRKSEKNFLRYKTRQKGLQIGAAISNRGKEISDWGRYHKSGQGGFQIEAGITYRCRTVQALQR